MSQIIINNFYFNLFRDIIKTISLTQDIDQSLKFLVQRLKEALNMDMVFVFLLNETGERLLKRAGTTDSKEIDYILHEFEKDFDPIFQGQTIIIEDSRNDYRFKGLNNKLSENNIKSAIFAPLSSKAQAIGILSFFSKKNRVFEPIEMEFIKLITEQSGILIEKSCMDRHLNIQISYLNTLNDISKAINSSQTLDDVINLITTRLPKLMGLKGCTIRLIHPKQQKLELVASNGLSEEYLTRGSIDDEKSIHDAISKKRFIHIYDAGEDSRVKFREAVKKEGIGSILAIPVLVEDRMLGILRLLTDKPRIFMEQEIDFAVAVAEQGGIAIKRARDFERISKLLAEIEQQETFLQTIFDNINAALVVLDIQKKIIFANTNFYEVIQKKQEDVIGRKYNEILEVTDDLFLNSDEFIYNFDKVKDDGETVYLEMSFSSIYRDNERDKIDFFIVILRDVTTRVLLEKETGEKQRLEGVLELARTVAHELNTPLFVALISIDVIKEKCENNPDILEDLETIKKNIKVSTNLIKKMTQITRYKSREYVGDVTMIDLDDSALDKGFF